MNRRRLAGALVAGFAFGLSGAPAEAESADTPGIMALEATGSVSAAPDIATVTVGVTAEADSAAGAMADQRARMAATVAALKAAGVADRDIQTSGLSLGPIYPPASRASSASGERGRISGYRAANQVTAIARDVDAVGPVLDALVSAGADTIGGVRFGLSNQAELEDEARRRAVAALLARAQLYAQAAGVELGRIRELRESGGFGANFTTARSFDAMETATPVEAGVLDVTITVFATFEIED